MIETPRFAHSAVAAPHHLAAKTGKAILAEGGNAIEAMVAMAATIAVVYPHMNSIGGDGFWLVREAGGRVHAIGACGQAGALATIKRYRDKGYDAIPPRGPDAALTVAGAISGWSAALTVAADMGGRVPLRDLLHEAIAYARDGYPISQSEARYAPKQLEELLAIPAFAATFRPSAAPLQAGAARQVPALAATLQHLASAGLDDFYRGDIARENAADLAAIGAPVTRADLEATQAFRAEPLSLKLSDCTVYNFPPPTQGLASLFTLGLFERLKVERAESFAHHHGLIEASKRALSLRDRLIADPARMKEDVRSYLEPGALEREAARIDKTRAAPWPLQEGDGDTIWMGAIDRTGLAVSYIQSLYWEYGSGCVLPKTGVLWQNRGMAFSLDAASHRALAPGLKPFHTLNPAMAAFQDGRVLSYGTMGGDGQPQFQAQVFSRYRLGQAVAPAVDAPRWLFGKTWGAASSTLKVESRFDSALIAALAKAGHEIEEVGLPYADGLGHAGMLVKHADNGRVEASHDPRSDGSAEGL